MSQSKHNTLGSACSTAGGVKRGGCGGGRGVDAQDLAELMATMNVATARLEESHTQLQAQVLRLSRELSQANAELERNKRLAALGEMAAGIAHEVRNPLGSMLLYAGMLEQDLRSVAPMHAGRAGKIVAAGRQMEGIISDVLSFAREVRLRPARVEVGTLLGEVVEACRAEVALKGVGNMPLVERGYVEDVTVVADGVLLRQALVNVVRNAFEAMERPHAEGHVLLLEVAKRGADSGGAACELAGGVVLKVRDTGPGVTVQVSERMFNPFFTTRGMGTGLGLSIVHRIVDAHGGRVSVINNSAGVCARREVGVRGACFVIELPAVCAVSPTDGSMFGTFAELSR